MPRFCSPLAIDFAQKHIMYTGVKVPEGDGESCRATVNFNPLARKWFLLLDDIP
jgi:hypothetical protein